MSATAPTTSAPRGPRSRPRPSRPGGVGSGSPLVLGHGRLPKILAGGGLVLMAGLWLLPFLWAIATSLQKEEDVATPGLTPFKGALTLDAYREIIERGSVPLWALNSLLVAGGVTLLTVAVSTLAAYGFSRGTFRGRRVALAVTVASIMVPPQLLVVPLFRQMLALRLVDTYWAIILPQVVAPMMVFILKRYFDAIPRELDEAARIDGASTLTVIGRVIAPLVWPGIVTVAVTAFIAMWDEFLFAQVFLTSESVKTVQVGIAGLFGEYGTDWGVVMAASVLAALPTIVLFSLLQRRLVAGMTAGAVKE